MGFSKAELQLIQNNLSWNECVHVNQGLVALNNKLKAMIDDYCDHDWKETYTEREVCRCTKCGEESL